MPEMLNPPSECGDGSACPALRSLSLEGCALDVDLGGGVHASSVVVWGNDDLEPHSG